MKNLMLFAAVAAVVMPIASAEAFYRSGGWSASGSRSSWSASTNRGGTASGGDGSWSATGARGGTASGGDGSWHATGANGGVAAGGYNHYYGGYYGGYHPPTVVNNYSTGCYNCGGWNTGGALAAGVVGGAMLVRAAASASTANAYNAGVAAGAAAANAGYVLGNLYAALPAGCTYQPQGGAAEYGCSNGAWFTPSYGANGVYYRAVPAP